MMIIWSLVALAAIVAIWDSIRRYLKVKRDVPRPLSEEERKLCARIIDSGLGQPWICRKAVETGECECLPCKKLEKAKADDLPLSV